MLETVCLRDWLSESAWACLVYQPKRRKENSLTQKAAGVQKNKMTEVSIRFFNKHIKIQRLGSNMFKATQNIG